MTDRYDKDLHMYCEGTKDPDPEKLVELRWRGLSGLLEHPVFGPKDGEFKDLNTPYAEMATYPKITTRRDPDSKPREIRVMILAK